MVTGRDLGAGFGNSGIVAVEMAGPDRKADRYDSFR
jgi:hypothetical protein